jgi:hypothetical protein
MPTWLVVVALFAGEPGFLKGQLHLHSNHSGDGRTPPGEVVRWYEAHGFDFIVFTDHNWVTVERSTARLLVLPGVELTQNVDGCTPPRGPRCPLHVNALFVSPTARGEIRWPPDDPHERLSIYRRALEVTRRLGGIAQLNHPNFHAGADAPLVAELARRDGLALLEIANMSWDVDNRPDDRGRASTEELWDAVLSTGATVYGTATDDAHHFFDAAAAGAHGDDVFPGDLGFVMVRAEKEPAAIRAALARGDFYASSGVLLGRLERTRDQLVVEIDARSPGAHHFDFIGTGGKVLASTDGRRATFAFASLAHANAAYVRVKVTDRHRRCAWGQPMRPHP